MRKQSPPLLKVLQSLDFSPQPQTSRRPRATPLLHFQKSLRFLTHHVFKKILLSRHRIGELREQLYIFLSR
jgi:hypothetical protein